MRTREIGPALEKHADAIHAAVEQLVHDMHPRLQKLAERIAVLAELDPTEPMELSPQLVALRISADLQRAVRAHLTWQVGESQALDFRSAQIAAALGLASPSNVRAKFHTGQVEAARRAAYESFPAGESAVSVEGFTFDFPIDHRFERNHEEGSSRGD